MNRSIIVLCMSAICFFPCIRAEATPVQLPVQLESQQQTNWCWAASALALLNRYDVYPGVTVETGSGYRGQCLIAQKLPWHLAYDCCDSPGDCNTGATVSELAAVLEDDYCLYMTVEDSTVTENSLANLVHSGKPVLVTRSNGSTSHVLVVVGHNDDYNYFETLEVLGGFIVPMLYDDIVDDGTWAWEETLFPDSAPPDDVYLRYSYSDYEYTWAYNAPGDLEAGPEYYVYDTVDDMTIFTCGNDDTITMKAGFEVAEGTYWFQAIPQS